MSSGESFRDHRNIVFGRCQGLQNIIKNNVFQISSDFHQNFVWKFRRDRRTFSRIFSRDISSSSPRNFVELPLKFRRAPPPEFSSSSPRNFVERPPKFRRVPLEISSSSCHKVPLGSYGTTWVISRRLDHMVPFGSSRTTCQ